MKFECYQINNKAPLISPGKVKRDWMDKFTNRWAYRCLPLTAANTAGWELLCPFSFEAEWNGGPSASDIVITSSYSEDMDPNFVKSHFSCGTITFHTGYLFRTEPGWQMSIGGPPNSPKHGISPLSAIVETDWLPYTFTMNWVFTAPGRVSFEKGEPFCFLTIMQVKALDNVEPVVTPLTSNPELYAQHLAWVSARDEFVLRRSAGDADTIKEGWQRFYFNGTPPLGGGPAPASRLTRRRLKNPC